MHSSRQTFHRYVEGIWLPHHAMAPTTRQGYTYIIGKHLTPYFGRMRMAEILPTDIRTFLGTLAGNGATAATVQRCKTVLGAIFTTALADGVVFLHPCRGIKGPAIGRTPVRILIPVELDRLLAVLPADLWRLWLDTAVETGARWGELAELRASDWAYTRATLVIVCGSTPTRWAISRRPAGWPPFSSSSSKIRDLRTSCAGCAPVLTTRVSHARSSALSSTEGNDEFDQTRPHGRDREHCRY